VRLAFRLLTVVPFVAAAMAPAAGASPLAPPPNAANALWVGQASGLLKISTADGTVLLEIPGLGEVSAVAVDDVALRVWALTGRTLHRFDFTGDEDLTTIVPPPGPVGGPQPPSDPPAASALAVDPSDGSIWVGLDWELYHLAW